VHNHFTRRCAHVHIIGDSLALNNLNSKRAIIAVIYNNLPTYLKQLEIISSFKCALVQYLIDGCSYAIHPNTYTISYDKPTFYCSIIMLLQIMILFLLICNFYVCCCICMTCSTLCCKVYGINNIWIWMQQAIYRRNRGHAFDVRLKERKNSIKKKDPDVSKLCEHHVTQDTTYFGIKLK
jgi:hypothetical protein